MFSYGLLHMDPLELNDHEKPMFINYMQTLGAVSRNYLQRKPIGMVYDWESRESVLLERLDEDDDDED